LLKAQDYFQRVSKGNVGDVGLYRAGSGVSEEEVNALTAVTEPRP